MCNRLGKTLALTLGITLALAAVLAFQTVVRFLLPAKAADRVAAFWLGAMGFPQGGGVNLLFPVLFFGVVVLILGAASYLVIRRAQLKG